MLNLSISRYKNFRRKPPVLFGRNPSPCRYSQFEQNPYSTKCSPALVRFTRGSRNSPRADGGTCSLLLEQERNKRQCSGQRVERCALNFSGVAGTPERRRAFGSGTRVSASSDSVLDHMHDRNELAAKPECIAFTGFALSRRALSRCRACKAGERRGKTKDQHENAATKRPDHDRSPHIRIVGNVHDTGPLAPAAVFR